MQKCKNDPSCFYSGNEESPLGLGYSANVEKDNTLCIMPTGGGKSLIYWMSGILMGGITIVISPLIALIDEQAEKIEDMVDDYLVFLNFNCLK